MAEEKQINWGKVDPVGRIGSEPFVAELKKQVEEIHEATA